jgi:hypothetical protein
MGNDCEGAAARGFGSDILVWSSGHGDGARAGAYWEREGANYSACGLPAHAGNGGGLR